MVQTASPQQSGGAAWASQSCPTRLHTAAAVAAHYFGHLAGRYDLRPRLPEIRVPTLVIAGESDWVCPPAAAHTLAGGIPGAELLVLPAGHVPFAEQPDRFLGAVRRFLARTPLA